MSAHGILVFCDGDFSGSGVLIAVLNITRYEHRCFSDISGFFLLMLPRFDVIAALILVVCDQVDDDEAEEDAPLEKRKKMFTKECKTAFKYKFLGYSCIEINSH